MDASASTHTAAKQTARDMGVQYALIWRDRLGIIFVEPAKLVDCGIGVLLFAFERKEPEQRTCHALVSELSFLCCEPECRWRGIELVSYITISRAGGDGG
jgi:hypothetical protein